MKLRSVLAVLAALALGGGSALLAGGCGSASETLDPVAKAAEATARAGGSQMSFTASITTPGLSSPLRMSGKGSFNFRGNEGDLALSVDGLPAEAQQALHGSSFDMTELYKGGIGYIHSPLFDGKLPGGARWVKVDMNRVLKAEGMSPASLSSGAGNPAQYLQYLKARGASLSSAGTETVRGSSTSRYNGTIDLLKASEQTPGGDPAQIRKTFETLIPNPSERNVPLSVWVDDKGLVRKMTMNIVVEPEQQRTETSLALEFFDFGPTPTVKAPADSETFDVTSTTLSDLPSS